MSALHSRGHSYNHTERRSVFSPNRVIILYDFIMTTLMNTKPLQPHVQIHVACLKIKLMLFSFRLIFFCSSQLKTSSNFHFASRNRVFFTVPNDIGCHYGFDEDDDKGGSIRIRRISITTKKKKKLENDGCHLFSMISRFIHSNTVRSVVHLYYVCTPYKTFYFYQSHSKQRHAAIQKPEKKENEAASDLRCRFIIIFGFRVI